MVIRIKSLEDTKKLGCKLGTLLKEGDVVCLDGDLGAGKTTITKSIAKGLEVEDYVTSPTFALINYYNGRLPVYHFDVYRLENIDEIYDLGFEDYFYGRGVSIIEWSKKIEKFLPKDRLEIMIKKSNQNNERIIELKAIGKRYEELVRELN